MTAPHQTCSILAVDDCPANLDILVELLADRYELMVAVDGPSALRTVQEDPPSLILLDIVMPGMDGFEVMRRLEADPSTASIPVIVLSSLDEAQQKTRGFELGAVDWIQKPFDEREVVARVSTHLRLSRLQRELLMRNRALVELEAQRDALVHMLVHDMRSPLQSLSMLLGAVREDLVESLDGDTVEDIDYATHSCQVLANMVEDILDVSRLECAQGIVSLDSAQLDRLVAQAVSPILGVLSEHDFVVALPEPPVMIRCDVALTERVLANLISNAVKFSPAGSVIRVAAVVQHGRVRIEVHDSGPGVDPAHRQLIFEKFGQVRLRREHGRRSYGLGLSFCRLVVEAHGGEIGVEDGAARGSIFWFTLPRDVPSSSCGSDVTAPWRCLHERTG